METLLHKNQGKSDLKVSKMIIYTLGQLTDVNTEIIDRIKPDFLQFIEFFTNK